MTLEEAKAMYRYSSEHGGNIFRMPLPRCDAELKVLSHWFFGLPLDLSNLQLWGKSVSYEVRQKFDDYAKREEKISRHLTRGCYDANQDFWRVVLGPLYCGGIATRAYGQATVVGGYRNRKRLEYWVQQRNGKRPDHLRPFFARLAARLSGAEKTV